MYSIDTCAFLWFLDDNPKLSEKAKNTIGTSDHLYLSVASLWEIAIKKNIKKLPLIHNDPFDRLIISTALEEELVLITHDSKIRRYGLDLLW